MFKKQVKCSDCGFFGLKGIEGTENVIFKWQEIQPKERIDVSETSKNAPFGIGCMRGQDHIIAGTSPPGKPIFYENLLRNANLPHKCVYYFHYHPGFTPEQHLELLRERTHRRFLIIVTLLSAAVGAGIATVVNLLW